MLLTVDIGNTNIVLGLFREREIIHHWRIDSNIRRTVDDYGHLVCYMLERSVGAAGLDGMVIASVVPTLTYVFQKLSQRYFEREAVIVDGLSPLGLELRVETPPEMIGPDRIVNALAVRERYAVDSIVVDMGTATTFDLVRADGTYEGGVIAPGINTCAEALVKKAAMLSRVEIEVPRSVIGHSTRSMMQSGIFFGAVGQIDGILSMLKKEWRADCRVIATGGFVNMLSRYCRQFDTVDPNLTLHGLNLAYAILKGLPQK